MDEMGLIDKLSKAKGVTWMFNSNYISYGFLGQRIFEEGEDSYYIDPKPLLRGSYGKLYVWLREKNLFASNGEVYVPQGEKLIVYPDEKLLVFQPSFDPFVFERLRRSHIERYGSRNSPFDLSKSALLVDELDPNFSIFAASIRLND